MNGQQAKLDESQNEYFDEEYVNDVYWDRLAALLDAHADKAAVRVVADFGGGNGSFIDRLLAHYPEAKGLNLDLSGALLEKNKTHPRKVLIHGSFLDHEFSEPVDLISLNWVLHHMVGRDFRSSDAIICATLEKCSEVLTPGGILIVFENIISGFVSDGLSSRILFEGTSSRHIAGLTKRLGANTAGVGIYYMGQTNLSKKLERFGFEALAGFDGKQHDYGWKLAPLLARDVTERCWVLRKSR